MTNKKVLVSGCFDLLHAGHVEFLKQAAQYGDLYVAIGKDSNIKLLKDILPTYSEKERIFIIKHLKLVKEAFLASGDGHLDFVEDIKRIQPDIFIVNEDGASKEKENLCKSLGVEYKVLKRIPAEGLPERSSTEMRARESKIPSRVSIAGGWLDQPYVSMHHSGPNITISIDPNENFNFRSGMATGTRNCAIKLWGNQLPEGDPIHLAKILFNYENPEGKGEIAGSQDAIGIVLPALKYAYYNGKPWPETTKLINDEEILSWLENKIYLIPLKPREPEFNPLKRNQLNKENAKKLSEAAENCFKAILKKDIDSFAKHFTESFDAQIKLFPESLPEWIKPIIEKYKNKGAKGWKLSGAGGGGYLVLISDKPIKNAIKIKIRRK